LIRNHPADSAAPVSAALGAAQPPLVGALSPRGTGIIPDALKPTGKLREIDMTNDNLARLRVAALIYAMVNAVVFGSGLLTVLSTPALAQHAFFSIPVVVAISFAVPMPLSRVIAPSMMMRFARSQRRR
jgi:hypothetical protein